VVIRSDAYFRQAAERWIRQAGILEPPVPLDDLAAAVGVPVLYVHLPRWFRSAIIYEDGMPIVLVNEIVTEPVRRAAFGHAIAHIITVLEDPTQGYPRDSAPTHRLADVIAEELLTPAFLVREQAMKWFNDYRYLSGLFGVAEEEMFSRMSDLGLVKARGVMWDY
jgi:Zn-dependent peptidase ImmA (M78 family)